MKLMGIEIARIIGPNTIKYIIVSTLLIFSESSSIVSSESVKVLIKERMCVK